MNDEFLQLISQKRPLLMRLLDEHGNETLHELARRNIEACKTVHPRAGEFTAVLKEIVGERLGEEMAQRLESQLLHYYGALTTDHHGTLNSDLGLSANLMFSEAVRAVTDPVLTLVPVLSCASVSQHNYDYPRGLMFQAERNGAYTVEKLSLLPSNSQGSIVWGFRAFLPEEVAKIKKNLREKIQAGTVSSEFADKVLNLIERLYKDSDVGSARNVCEQFTKVNALLWEQIYAGDSHAPGLVMIEHEELTTRLLLRHHLSRKTLLHELFFGTHAFTLLAQLETAMSKYVRQGSLNTHLFWWVTDTHKRVDMRLQEGYLVSEDESVRVRFEPGAIAEALREKKMMPNLLTVFTVIHLYYGFACLGGFNQMHFLSAMRSLYNSSGVDTVEASGESPYAFGLNPVFLHEASRIAPYPSSMVLFPELRILDQFKQAFKHQTLNQAFSRDWQIVYDILKEH